MTYRTIGMGLLVPFTIILGTERQGTTPLVAASAPVVWTESTSSLQASPSRYVVAASGNEALYRVQERIVGVDVPNYEAIGRTQGVTGAIVFDDAGRILPAQSKIVINVTGLKSDQERRDGFVQRRLLETEQYPTVELVPTSIRGLTGPLPTSGERTFQLIGNLTIRGVTRSTTWNVTARFNGGTVTGVASTRFTFADFSMEKPSVPVVLSLADEFGLEYGFTLVKS